MALQGIETFIVDDECLDVVWRAGHPNEFVPEAARAKHDALRLDAIRREIETTGLLVASAASLVNALAAGHRHVSTIRRQLQASLPPELRCLTATMADFVVGPYPATLVAGLQEVPVRLGIARSMTMALDGDDSNSVLLQAAARTWRRLCEVLLDLLRDLRGYGGAGEPPDADPSADASAMVSTERLLAAALLGGTPCVGLDGLLEVPGWIERRAVPRVLMDRPGALRVGAVHYPIRIADLSRTGAGFTGPLPSDIGDRCEIVFGGTAIACRIVWHDGRRGGVQFDGALTVTDSLLADLK